MDTEIMTLNFPGLPPIEGTPTQIINLLAQRLVAARQDTAAWHAEATRLEGVLWDARKKIGDLHGEIVWGIKPAGQEVFDRVKCNK